MSNTTNEKNAGKSGALIIVLGIALLVGVIVLVVALVSVFKGASSGEDTTLYTLTSAVSNYHQTTEDSTGSYFDNGTVTDNTVGNNQPSANQQGNQGVQDSTVSTTKNEAVAYYEQFSKNGENILSDNHENKYIKLVSSNYGVDTELLVAIYSEPDTGNNFVLEFDGTRDSEGNVVKSPDTLSKVYLIDLERNISMATKTGAGNQGVSYAEGLFCFNMVKTLVMEQYPDYFTGIEA